MNEGKLTEIPLPVLMQNMLTKPTEVNWGEPSLLCKRFTNNHLPVAETLDGILECHGIVYNTALEGRERCQIEDGAFHSVFDPVAQIAAEQLSQLFNFG